MTTSGGIRLAGAPGIEPTKERRWNYAADVPLICDPVPTYRRER